MQKSMPQSKQASVCITKHTKNFLYFQHQSTYLKNALKNNKQEKPESWTGGARLSPKQKNDGVQLYWKTKHTTEK